LNGEGALEEGAGGGGVALVAVQEGEVVEAAGGLGVVRPQHALADCQSALQKGPGDGQALWSPEEREALSGVGTGGARRPGRVSPNRRSLLKVRMAHLHGP
jgi:hypothetical protein